MKGSILIVVIILLTGETFMVSGQNCGGTCDATGGECVDPICYCKPNYWGANCATDCAAAACASPEVCHNATACVDCSTTCTANQGECRAVDGSTPACKCNAGFTGNTCQTDICASNPCQNNGVCVGEVNGYSCDCTESFTGTNCEKECTEGCTLLQQCNDDGATPTCQCKTGLSGTDCSTIACGANNIPCENGGTCADAACTCTKNFAGTICELECTPACGDNQQCELVDSSPQCNHGVTAVVTPALIASLLMMLVFL